MKILRFSSQSPDGDFFDPENGLGTTVLMVAVCHSPLTGIFLIRSCDSRPLPMGSTESQSPDGDFFDPE